VFLGGPGSGKSWLVEALARRECGRGLRPAIVDCDTGQSHIGPPSTIAWGRCPRRGFSCLESLPVKGMFFCGELSCARMPSLCLRGIERMHARARKASSLVLVDTDGYVEGPGAVEYKARLCAMLAPERVVAVQRDDELEPVLKRIRPETIIRRRADPRARPRSSAERSLYRSRRFRHYFSGARPLSLPRRLLSFSPHTPPDPRGILAGLISPAGDCLAVGAILAVTRLRIRILTPLRTAARVRAVAAGAALLPVELLPSFWLK
jgi:polynucleotide 5'-hydroxyl-kinase GRC3/NOL9